MSDDSRDGDDSDDGDDLPPPSDPEPKPQYPEVSQEERERRAEILFRPQNQKLIQQVVGAQVARWGTEAVEDTASAVEAEALIVPGFPVDDEITAFLRTLTERIAKREHRARKRDYRKRASLAAHEPTVAHPYFGGDDGERADRDAAYEAALAGVSRGRGFQMLYERVVHRKSAAEIAAQFKVSVAAYYAATKRVKKDARGLVAAAAAAALFLLGGRAYLQGPQNTVARDDAPTSYDRAMAIAKEGRKECDQGEWAHCLELLDEAANVDPSIRDWKAYQPLHAQAVDALKPPKVDDTPAPEPPKAPDKGPKGPKAPDKGPKGPDKGPGAP